MSNETKDSVLNETMRSCRMAFLSVGVFSFFINMLVLTVPIYMVQVFDRVMTSRSEDTLLVLSLAAVMALSVMAVLDIIRSRMLVRIGMWLDSRLSPELFSASLSPSVLVKERSMQRLRDLSTVRNFLTGSAVFALLDAPWVPLFIALIYVLHPTLGLAATLGAVALFGLAIVNELVTRTPLRRANAAAMGSMNAAETMVRHAETAGGMGMSGMLANWWQVRNAHALKLQADASDRAGVIVSLSKFIRLALQIVILGLAAFLVVHQEVSVGAMIAASIILTRALAPVEQSIGTWRGLVAARAAFDRIRETMGIAEADKDRMPLPRPEGHLVVSKLTLTPPGAEDPVFRDVSFDAAPGEILGITGPSGAGKSTLVRMLIGVVKTDSGKVRLDGADVFSWRSDDLGNHVGYVPQVVEMLPGTIRDNIARFTNAQPEKVIEASQRAGVHELILSLPDGYDTMVGGSDDLLSVGARQRIALARALFGDPQMLILDEPYSNLDAEGVTALVAALEDLKSRGRTIVIVAHRPSILAHADRVLMLQDGTAKLVEKSRRANLKLLGEQENADHAPAETGPVNLNVASNNGGD